VATVLAGAAMAGAVRLFTGGVPVTSGVDAALTVVVGLLPAAAVFLAAARVMHIREVEQLADVVRRRERG
jgi:hypothetical protein